MVDTSPRPRFGGSKVRSGCFTCKTRRVKCDEEKPNCQRCEKGGRQCGYATPSYKRVNAGTTFVIVKYIPAAPTASPGLNPREQRSLDFYRSRAALELSGAFAPHFWGKLMLRVAHHESAIRHALIAIGALYEKFETSCDKESLASDFAIQQYGKAIQQVLKIDVAASKQSVDVAVLSCVLFTAFESLQGHYKSALTHINSGVKILEENESANGRTLGDRYVPAKIMHKLFLRLDTQALEIGDSAYTSQRRDPERQPLPEIPEAFTRVEQASFTFEVYLNRLHHFLIRAQGLQQAYATVQSIQAIYLEHSAMIRYYHEWCTALDKSSIPVDAPSMLILQIHMVMIGIMLRIYPTIGEMVYDQFTSDWDQLVTLAEKFMSPKKESAANASTAGSPTSALSGNGSPKLSQSYHKATNQSSHHQRLQDPSNKPSFTLALGILPPIYVTCSRCRDPTVRRRALHLLATCNRKEGIWDSKLSAKVAERLIAIEEAGAAVAVVTDASQIPEHARVVELNPTFGAGTQGRIKYRKSDVRHENKGIREDRADAQNFEELFEW